MIVGKSQSKSPYTAIAAAEELAVAVSNVYRYVQEGKLEPVPVNGKALLITAESVARLKRARALRQERGVRDLPLDEVKA